jgi:hypothetical protein
MAKRAIFWTYFALLHLVAIIAVIFAMRSTDTGPFRIETTWGNSNGGGMTAYFRDQLIASVHVKDNQLLSVSAYAPGDLGELKFARDGASSPWKSSHTRYTPGNFHGRDIGNYEFICIDHDNDGIMETYLQRTPQLVKTLTPDAWEEKK